MAGRSAALHASRLSTQSSGTGLVAGYNEWKQTLDSSGVYPSAATSPNASLDVTFEEEDDYDDEEKSLLSHHHPLQTQEEVFVPTPVAPPSPLPPTPLLPQPSTLSSPPPPLAPPSIQTPKPRGQANKRKSGKGSTSLGRSSRSGTLTPGTPREASSSSPSYPSTPGQQTSRARPVARWFAGLVSRLWAFLGSSAVGRELQALLPMAAPVMAGGCLNQLLNIVDLMFVGNFLGPEYLAAAALGNCYFNLLSALFLGGSSGIDDLCSEAMGGGVSSSSSGTKHTSSTGGGMEGSNASSSSSTSSSSPARGRGHRLASPTSSLHLPSSDPTVDAAVTVLGARGALLLSLASVFVILGLWGTEGFLVHFGGQDRELAGTAAGFCDSLVIGILPLAVSTALGRYLAARGVVWPGITVDLIANLMNVTLNIALIEVDGFLGAPLATSVARWGHVVMIGSYIAMRRPPRFVGVQASPSPAPTAVGSEEAGGEKVPSTVSATAAATVGASSTTPTGSAVVAGGREEGMQGQAKIDSAAAAAVAAAAAEKATGSVSSSAPLSIPTLPLGPFLPPPPPPPPLPLNPFAPPPATTAASVLAKPWHDPEGLGVMGVAMAGGALTVALESWPMEISALVAGRLDVPSLIAHVVVLNTCVFISLGLPMGLGVAASARIPQLLSAGDALGARGCATVAILTSITWNLAAAIALLGLRGWMGAIFTPSPEVAELCAHAALMAALYQLCDGTACVVGGVLRGLGWGGVITPILFFGWCALGLPLGAALAFRAGEGGQGWGVFGLWLGLLAGVATIAGAFALIFRRVDWDLEAKRALRRRERE